MGAPTFSEIELALTSTALSGDAGGLYRMAAGLMDQGVGFDSLLFDYLLPIERAVGQRWQQGDYLVAEEHAVTAAIETVISLLSGMFDRPSDGPSVLVATAEGDNHSLPARAVASHLLFLGYNTTFLGANVPGRDLLEFIESGPPDVVVLSCAMTSHLLGARSVIQAIHAAGVPVIAGGKAFGADGSWARSLGADVWVGSFGEVAAQVDRLDQLSVQTTEPEDLPADLIDLIAVRAAILAEADAELAGEGGPIDPRLTDELKVLLGAVEASMLVGDEQVVVEMLEWQADTLDAYGYQADSVASALHTALSQASPAAAEILSRGLQTKG